MKKYLVSMECCTISRIEVEAKNKEEAIKIAKNDLRGMCQGDSLELYEIEIIN